MIVSLLYRRPIDHLNQMNFTAAACCGRNAHQSATIDIKKLRVYLRSNVSTVNFARNTQHVRTGVGN